MSIRQPQNSAWRLFPWAVAAGMGVVVLVNGTMIWSALDTFPGKAGRDGFELSNRYNTVLERVAEQAHLHWSVAATSDAKGHPVLTLTDANGAPLIGARIEGTAERPVGEDRRETVVFNEKGGGRYVGDIALDLRGQWDVLITARANGHTLTTTRRIVVP